MVQLHADLEPLQPHPLIVDTGCGGLWWELCFWLEMVSVKSWLL